MSNNRIEGFISKNFNNKMNSIGEMILGLALMDMDIDNNKSIVFI